MQKTFCLTIGLLWICLPHSYGGTDSASTKVYMNQLSVNISPMLRYNENRLPWLDYRFFYSEHRALRLQIGFDGYVRGGSGESNVTSPFFNPNNRLDSFISNGPDKFNMLTIRAGHLWYWQIAPDIRFIAGAEGQFTYWEKKSKQRIETFQSSGQFVTEFETDTETREWSHVYGALPTVGIVWNPARRISLSIESGAGFFWGTEVKKSITRFSQVNSQNPDNPFVQHTAKHLKTNIVEYKMDPFLGLIIGFRI